MLQSSVFFRFSPLLAVALGLAHAALFGGLNTPVAFTRAVLAVGVLCPLMLAGRPRELRPAPHRLGAAVIPVAVNLVLGPLLAYAIGHCLLSSHPEQAVALLLLALLPGSALAPVWARSMRGSGSRAMTLTLTGWVLAAPIVIRLVEGFSGSGAHLSVVRDLAFLGALPVLVGWSGRAVLVEAFEPDEYAALVEPVRRIVMHASLVVLLFFLTASTTVSALVRGVRVALPAFAAVALLDVCLFAVCGIAVLGLRARLSRASVRAILPVAGTRQAMLAMSLLPCAVGPGALANAFVIPLVALILELVVGTAVFGLHALGAEARSSATPGAQDGSPSIVPE